MAEKEKEREWKGKKVEERRRVKMSKRKRGLEDKRGYKKQIERKKG